jgi:ribosome biogenesis GTPase
MTGLVYKSTGSWYTKIEQGRFYRMPYEREIRIKGIKSTNPIAVGDVVDYELKNPRILLQEPFTTSTKEKLYCP